MDRVKSSKAVMSGRTPERRATIGSAASLAINPRRMIQNFLLIWLDTNFNEAASDCQRSIRALRCIVASINTFNNAQECVEFLRKIREEKVFMIVSGSLGQQIVPKIESLPLMESIYVFCRNKAVHEQWASKISKIRGVYTEMDHIYEALRIDRRICDHNLVPISLNRVDSSFMYTQLLKEAIMQIQDDDDEQIKKLVDFCQQQGDIDFKQIKNIQTEYYQHKPIWWYTGDTFIHSILNRALREMDTDIILIMQFFIRHLHQDIAELYKEQKQTSSSRINKKFTVYRGQALSVEVFDKLKSAKGELMSFNNFLSTSLDREVSLSFANRTNGDMVGILFVMSIDSRVAETSNIPYADVSKVSYYGRNEAEILFTTHTIFRINHIQRMTSNQSNRLWEVQLTLAGNDDNELNQLMEHVQSEIKGESWFRLGSILIKMGKSEKAEQLYHGLLARATNESERAICLHQLGWVYETRGKYSTAAKFYGRSLEIEQRTLPANHPNLASSYNNLGNVYFKMGEYSQAFEYYQKSLKIKRIVLPPNHPSSAQTYMNIGGVYFKTGEYSKALEYHQKSLEIKKIALPPNHPDLAESYMGIGLVYNCMGNCSKALESHHKSLEIKKTVLPPNHPDLATSYANIGLTYESIRDYRKAILNLQTAHDMWHKSLPATHPNVILITKQLNRVKSKM